MLFFALFVLNLFGPFLKGIFDINVYYFYDKKEKIEKKDIIEINNELDSENRSNESDYEKNKRKAEEYKDEDYQKEMKEKEEKIRNKMFKKIFDNSFKYIYLEKNNSMIESGSEHVPYKKYITIKKFIFLVLKSIFFAVINFYATFGSLEAGHNIIDLNGNMIDFRRLQITLWSNYCFIIFFENLIFTYYFTVYKLVELIFFVLIYIIIFILYQKKDTNSSNPFNSLLLVLNFLLIVLVCSFVNFWIYIVNYLFDNGVVYKLRYMKILDKYLDEMKEIAEYKEELEEESDENDVLLFNKTKKNKDKDKFNILEIINEDNDSEKNKDKDFGKINNMDPFNVKELSSINNNNNFQFEYDMSNDMNNNNKIVINRKKRGFNESQRNFNEMDIDQKFVENFNKNLIQKKEIQNSQYQYSINLMKQNQMKKKDITKKYDLKYVKDNQ